MNTTVDLSFSLQSQQPIPADHGYALYGALSCVLPAIHMSNGIGVHPIRGAQTGDRRLQLNDRSRLALRIVSGRIGDLLPLAGKAINVAGSQLRIGVPQVVALQPRPALRSRIVTTKNGQDQARFETELRRQLDALEVSDNAIVSVNKRRTLRIKQKEVVGYEVVIEGITAEESLAIQETGLGGRRHMGCGIFTALK